MEERLTRTGRRAYGVGVTAGRDGGRAAIVTARLLAVLATVLAGTAVALPLVSGYGYLDEYPVQKYFRDARVMTLYEGTSQIQKLLIGRAETGLNAFA